MTQESSEKLQGCKSKTIMVVAAPSGKREPTCHQLSSKVYRQMTQRRKRDNQPTPSDETFLEALTPEPEAPSPGKPDEKVEGEAEPTNPRISIKAEEVHLNTLGRPQVQAKQPARFGGEPDLPRTDREFFVPIHGFV